VLLDWTIGFRDGWFWDLTGAFGAFNPIVGSLDSPARLLDPKSFVQVIAENGKASPLKATILVSQPLVPTFTTGQVLALHSADARALDIADLTLSGLLGHCSTKGVK
jgi:hypothetical protein